MRRSFYHTDLGQSAVLPEAHKGLKRVTRVQCS